MSYNETTAISALFSPGQGTHIENMLALAEKHPEVNECLEIADEQVTQIYGTKKIEGKNVSEWATGDNVHAISLDTRIAQPLIVAISIGLNEVLAKREHFTTSYGNSLGELAALATAGAMSREDSIELAVIRGQVSHEASSRSGGKMVVIKNASQEFISQLKLGERYGIVRAVNLSPDSITLAGLEDVIKNIYQTLAEDYKKAKKNLSKDQRRELQNAIMMGINGAFHSFLMKHAEKEFNSAFDQVEISNPTNMLWFSNYSGEYEGNPQVIQEHLVKQLTHEVDLWTHIGKLISLGHTRFVESGTAPHLTNEYQLQQQRKNLPSNIEFVFGLDELKEAA